MIATAALAWVVTGWFAAIGALSAVGLARSRRSAEAVSYAAHALMSGVMAIMPWAWSTLVPPIVWIVVFTAVGLWYAAIAAFRPDAQVGPGAAHHGNGVLLWYHAAMMASMAWMSALTAMMLQLSGHGPGHAMEPGAALTLWQLPPWMIVVTLAFAAMFAMAAVWFFVRLLAAPTSAPPTPLPLAVELLLSLGMALGMGTALLVMGV